MKKLVALLLSLFIVSACAIDKNFNNEYKKVADYLSGEVSKGMNPSKFSNSWFSNNWLNRLYECHALAKKNKNYDHKMQDCMDMFNDVQGHIGNDRDSSSIEALDAIKKFNAFYVQKKQVYNEEQRELLKKQENSKKEQDFYLVRRYIIESKFSGFYVDFLNKCEQSPLKDDTKADGEKSLRSDCSIFLNKLKDHRVTTNKNIRTKIFGDNVVDTLDATKREFEWSSSVDKYSKDYSRAYWSELEKNEAAFKNYGPQKGRVDLKKICEGILFKEDGSSIDRTNFDTCRHFLKNMAADIQNNQGYSDYFLGRKKRSLEYIQILLETIDHKEREFFINEIDKH